MTPYMLNLNKVQKHIFLKVFKQFSQLEKTINSIKIQGISMENLTILKKLNLALANGLQTQPEIEKLEFKCEIIFEAPVKTGIIKSQEFGTIFIGGNLTSIFLYEVKGKPIGEMSTGIYGVLRGLGATGANLNLQLNSFQKQPFMLIVRAEESLVAKLEESFENVQEEPSF